MTMNHIPADRLLDVVRGRDPRFARTEAIGLLAESQEPRRESLLADIIENPSEPRRYRLVAAMTLGRVRSEAAEAILLRNLEAQHPAVREVLRSLGRIGGPRALKAIEELELPSDHPAKGDEAFAAGLIRYRLRLDGEALPLPPPDALLEPPSEDVRRVDVRQLEEERAQAVVKDLERYPHGIVLDPEAATLIECAGEINVLVPNRELAKPQGRSWVLEGKALVALVGLQSPENGDYSVSYLVLTNPVQSGEVEVLVTRSSGRYVLAGTAHPEGDGLVFDLRAVRRAGARSLSVRGVLRDGRLLDVEASASSRQEPRKRPDYRKPGTPVTERAP